MGAYGGVVTVTVGQITGSLTNLSTVITEDSFHPAAIDGKVYVPETTNNLIAELIGFPSNTTGSANGVEFDGVDDKLINISIVHEGSVTWELTLEMELISAHTGWFRLFSDGTSSNSLIINESLTEVRHTRNNVIFAFTGLALLATDTITIKAVLGTKLQLIVNGIPITYSNNTATAVGISYLSFGKDIVGHCGVIVKSISYITPTVASNRYYDFTTVYGNSILNGGGNLRCYTDTTKAVQIPIDVVTFVTGGTPKVLVWVLNPTLQDGDTVYIEADTVATAQPTFSAAFGRNAAWIDYELVLHGSFDDVSGNHGTLITVGSPTIITTAPLGSAIRFTDSSQYIHTNSTSIVPTDDFTMSLWVAENGGGDAALMGIADSSSPFGNFSIIWDEDFAVDRVDMLTFARSITGSTQLITTQVGPSQGEYVLTSASVDSDIGTTGYIASTFGISSGVSNSRVDLLSSNLNRISINRLMDSSPELGGAHDVSEVRLRYGLVTSNFVATEYNNQSSPETFWEPMATWTEQGDSGINSIYFGSDLISDVKFYNGSAYVDTVLNINEVVVWQV